MTPPPVLPSQVFALLRERFGYQAFRPAQGAIIAALLQGHNVLAVMPTGSGKSLCYQLPAVLRAGCAVVISPLIALMQDQVDSMRAQGVAATFINSTLSLREQRERLQGCRQGAYDLLYVAPERFRNPHFLQGIAQTAVSLFAVDEAHCISAWGHDFRPDYLRLQQAIAHLGRPQVLALTATATVDVQQDIIKQLDCGAMQRFVSGFDRPNLTYRVQRLNTPNAKLDALYEVLKSVTAGSAIIYAATRRAVEEIAAFLHLNGVDGLIYHAGLPDAARRQAQETFMARQNCVMVATNAFGMGVDKPDVRCVVHFNLPRSIEAYYQEAGRAGRDGLPADCVLLFSYGDVRIQEFLIEQSHPPRDLIEEVYALTVACSRQRPEVPLRSLLSRCRHRCSDMQIGASARLLEKAGYVERLTGYRDADEEGAGGLSVGLRLARAPVAPKRLNLDWAALHRRRQHELGKLRRVVGYANARHCRRRRILGYFGDTLPQRNCGACDYCCKAGALPAAGETARRTLSEDEWLIVQKILSCVARMRGRYGRAKIVLVLMGSRARDIRDTPLTQLSTYGILRGMPRPEIEAYVEALLEADCLQVVGDEFPKLGLTELGQAVMRRQQLLQLALPRRAPLTISRSAAPATLTTGLPSRSPHGLTTSSAPAESPPAATCDPALFERLRVERTALAQREAVPPYCVVNDRTLREMATHLPADRAAFLRIHGIGPAKADKYGTTFLAVIRQYCEGQGGPAGKA